MDYSKHELDGVTVELSLFGEGRKEAHAILHSTLNEATVAERIAALGMAVNHLERILPQNMAPVFMRWFFSDISNQASLADSNFQCAASMIQQPPADGSKVGLWIILQQNSDFAEQMSGVWTNNRGELWMGDTDSQCGDPETMTRRYLDQLSGLLESRSASLLHNCLRTWYFVRDIDVNYQGVVKGRNDVFKKLGLTPETHFIASTGINGDSAGSHQTVAFNAYADTRVTPEQLICLKAASHMNATVDYGVAFERATAVDYGDRRHLFVSGTASINNRGEIVYPGDIVGQVNRMLENIETLLAEGQCDWNDVAHLIVYLRDFSDYSVVRDIYAHRFPRVPTIIVEAPVCRPGWLVETECMAIKKMSFPSYEAY